MGNRLSDEEILKYLRNGWYFHKKQVGKYLYLTTRKGQLTRSHGAFNEKDGVRIKTLEQQWINELVENENNTKINPSEMNETRRRAIKTFNRLSRNYTKELSLARGILKQIFCKFKEEEFCNKWILCEDIELFKHLDNFHNFLGETREDYAKKIVDNEGNNRWSIKASTKFCETCSQYEPENRFALTARTQRKHM